MFAGMTAHNESVGSDEQETAQAFDSFRIIRGFAHSIWCLKVRLYCAPIRSRRCIPDLNDDLP